MCGAMKPTIFKKWMLTLAIVAFYLNVEIQGMENENMNTQENLEELDWTDFDVELVNKLSMKYGFNIDNEIDETPDPNEIIDANEKTQVNELRQEIQVSAEEKDVFHQHAKFIIKQMINQVLQDILFVRFDKEKHEKKAHEAIEFFVEEMIQTISNNNKIADEKGEIQEEQELQLFTQENVDEIFHKISDVQQQNETQENHKLSQHNFDIAPTWFTSLNKDHKEFLVHSLMQTVKKDGSFTTNAKNQFIQTFKIEEYQAEELYEFVFHRFKEFGWKRDEDVNYCDRTLPLLIMSSSVDVNDYELLSIKNGQCWVRINNKLYVATYDETLISNNEYLHTNIVQQKQATKLKKKSGCNCKNGSGKKEDITYKK